MFGTLGKAKEGTLESFIPLGHSDELLATLGGHQHASTALMGDRGGAHGGARECVHHQVLHLTFDTETFARQTTYLG